MQQETTKLKKLASFIRYLILSSTSQAKSGHPTSSLSAVELMVGLLFTGIFKYDLKNPGNFNNDRLIFSKGHAAPLLYSLFMVAGALRRSDLFNIRKFGSNLEGHPTPRFKYAQVATGSLGQGLSIGFGMALNAKYLDKLDYRTYVLMGDSEFSEGSIWETLQLASYYKLNNLIGILDVNRLGQRGETMFGHHLESYKKRISAFGWETCLVNGHRYPEILKAYKKALAQKEKPTLIIARTVKGKGISFLEDKNGWHGKALDDQQLQQAISELGDIDQNTRGKIDLPVKSVLRTYEKVVSKGEKPALETFKTGDVVATRKAYGIALAKLGYENPKVVALDAEVSNSTYSEIFKLHHPERFFEMFIAEQNMVGAAIGLQKMGKLPYVSTFAAFLTRAFDQIRMAQYSQTDVTFIGSHAGISIGEDGPSQMGLEDISLMRCLRESTVLYPSDAIATEKLLINTLKQKGIKYLRTTRMATPVIYDNSEDFPIGQSKTLKSSKDDIVTLVGCGITLFECLKSYEILRRENINARVIDLYSIKPIDEKTLIEAASETKIIITVEDHYPEGGVGEAVGSVIANHKAAIVSLAVNKIPVSGKPEELLDYERISAKFIVKSVLSYLKNIS